MGFLEDKPSRKIVLNIPLNWVEWTLSEQAKFLRLARDEENNLLALPILVAGMNGDQNIVNAASVGAHFEPTPMATHALNVKASQQLYNVPEDALESQRTPSRFVSAGGLNSFTIWNPAAGATFRLMGFTILIVAPARAAAAAGYIQLRDAAAGPIIFTCNFWCSLAAAVVPGVYAITVNFPGNGYLSVLADNNLEAVFDAAITAGVIQINAWGTEE